MVDASGGSDGVLPENIRDIRGYELVFSSIIDEVLVVNPEAVDELARWSIGFRLLCE